LGAALNENIRRARYAAPTPVQKHAIPVGLAGRDIMACAQARAPRAPLRARSRATHRPGLLAPALTRARTVCCALCLSRQTHGTDGHSSLSRAAVLRPTDRLWQNGRVLAAHAGKLAAPARLGPLPRRRRRARAQRRRRRFAREASDTRRARAGSHARAGQPDSGRGAQVRLPNRPAPCRRVRRRPRGLPAARGTTQTARIFVSACALLFRSRICADAALSPPPPRWSAAAMC
jgi:hypothetical protein